MLEEGVRKRGSKVGAINVDGSKLWKIDFFAARTEHFEAGGFEVVAQSDGKSLLAITQRTWAMTIDA